MRTVPIHSSPCVSKPRVSPWHSQYTHSCVSTRWLNLQLLLEYMVDDEKKKKKLYGKCLPGNRYQAQSCSISTQIRAVYKSLHTPAGMGVKGVCNGQRCCHSLLSVLWPKDSCSGQISAAENSHRWSWARNNEIHEHSQGRGPRGSLEQATTKISPAPGLPS